MNSQQCIQLLHFGTGNSDLVANVVRKVGRDWHFLLCASIDMILAAIKANSPNIIIFDQNSPASLSELIDHTQSQGDATFLSVIGLASNGRLNMFNSDMVFDILESPITEWRVAKTLHNAVAQLSSRLEIRRLKNKLEFQSQELSELNQIGIALSAEHDYDALLNLILQKGREITNSDAGSLYLIEKNPALAPQESDFLAD